MYLTVKRENLLTGKMKLSCKRKIRTSRKYGQGYNKNFSVAGTIENAQKTDMEKDSPRFLEPRAVLSEKLRVRGAYRAPTPVHCPGLHP